MELHPHDVKLKLNKHTDFLLSHVCYTYCQETERLLLFRLVNVTEDPSNSHNPWTDVQKMRFKNASVFQMAALKNIP